MGEERKLRTAAEKAKIRERYKGTDLEDISVIPALPRAGLHDGFQEKRVAVYARVSTEDPRQTSSYELQKNHYQDMIERHPGWRLVDIYADEGISGTSLQHRDAFIRMIDDCHGHKIDLIVTKSVSRFARNVLDCIGYVRQLAALDPPVGILFETENIYTLDSNSEMSLSFISTLAQEESRNKSEIMNASIEMRFRRGIFLTPPLLGYDQDENGDLVINEAEAKTVKLIFYLYLYGYTCTQIADALTQLERPTKRGNTIWSPGSVLQILQNERHCGDVLARKTWTPSYLDHRSKKNRQDRNQYLKKRHHAAIISRDDFIAVQQLISNAKYGNRVFLPALQVIADGALKGFVLVNPRWAGFKAKDYLAASASVYGGSAQEDAEEFEVSARPGDFDLRGYEIVRVQFFDISQKQCVTFSASDLNFSTDCVRKLPGVLFVELLIHPGRQLLAVRPSARENKRAIQWAKDVNGRSYARSVGGSAFLPTLFALFGWDLQCKYRVRGVRRSQKEGSVLLFDVRDTEVFIPSSYVSGSTGTGTERNGSPASAALPVSDHAKSIVAYPSDWIRGFGTNYYCHQRARELAAFGLHDTWEVQSEGIAFTDHSALQVTSMDALHDEIRRMVEEMKQEIRHE